MDEAAAGRQAFSIGRLFWFFLRIGCTAFGGFMSLISIIQIELTEKRRAMEQKDMLNGIALASILPGPIAVNVTAYAGFRLYGVAGAAASMLAVILPSFVLMIVAAEIYLRWGELPAIRAVFNGIIPAIVAVILQAGWNIGRKTVTGVKPFVLAVLAALAIVLVKGFYVTLAVIFVAGALGPLLFRGNAAAAVVEESASAAPVVSSALQWLFAFLLVAVLLLFLLPSPDWIRSVPVAHLFTTFSGMSLTLFGGGYVFIPMIQKIVVEGYHWITAEQFNAAIAMGQITPGPILISATFIGYKVAGIGGAVIATAGIFLPPAMLMVLAAHWLGHLQKSALLQRVLHGIRIAVCGMIFAAAVLIAGTASREWGVLAIFVLALVALLYYRITPVLVIPVAGVLGLSLYAAGM